MDNVHHHYLTEQHFNMRLDAAISSLSSISRSAITRLIKGGHVLVNNTVVHEADFKIKELSEIVLTYIEPAQHVNMQASKVDFEVIYEDKYLLIVNKPAGLTVHPGVANY